MLELLEGTIRDTERYKMSKFAEVKLETNHC